MTDDFGLHSAFAGPPVPFSPLTEGDDTSEKEFYADPNNFGDLLPEFEVDLHDESMDVDPICELRPAADRDLFSAVVEEQATMVGHALNPGRIDEQVRDAVLKLGRKDTVRMPWESWPVKPTDHLKHLGNLFHLPVVGRFDRPIEDSSGTALGSKQETWSSKLPFASRRLLAAKLAKSDDQLKSAALSKLRNIVLFHPSDSQLGRSMLDKAGSLVGEDELQRSLNDAVASRAIGTLVKRVSDFNRFAEWQVTINRRRPLSPTESDIYQYLCHLQDVRAGATAGASFLKAWNFMRFVIGADSEESASVFSGRVKGVTTSMFANKRKLTQAPPIPADYVYKMETLILESHDSRICTIVGFLLFCIYSCSRFGDAAKGRPSALEFQVREELTLVEIMLSDYKTATGERRAILLPLIALGNGLHNYSWAEAWQKARSRSGANEVDFLMPAECSNNGAWLHRKMTTLEGSYWVKEVLALVGMKPDDAQRYSSHSLKATCLSWAAKAGSMTLQERLWLGHHQSNESKMAVTYARDALVAVLIKLRRILQSIKDGLFDPDLSRVDRIVQATGLSVSAQNIPPKSSEELDVEQRLEDERVDKSIRPDESDVESDTPIEASPIAIPGEKQLMDRDPFPEVSLDCCVRHRLSGVVHLIAAGDLVACGRRITVNMIKMQSGSSDKASLVFCEQCRTSTRNVT